MDSSATRLIIRPRLATYLAFAACIGFACCGHARAETSKILSHPPLRVAPPPSKRALGKGPAYFADARSGNDTNEGSKESPWRTIQYALGQLEAGDTLYLRDGTYYENVRIALAGRKDAPITIRSYRGEQAVIDGGYREFFQSSAEAWQPATDGANGEYVSSRRYGNIRNVIGSFGDSMIGLNTYFHAMDLRGKSGVIEKKPDRDDIEPLYCGPGLWYDRATGLIHARLFHTDIPKIDNYRGETDPRKLPLVVARFGSVPLTINHAKHVRLQDLVIRGAGYDTVVVDYGIDLDFDNVTIWCGTYGMRTWRTGPLRFHRSALYGNIPPWLFRSDSSKRAYPGRPTRDITRLNTHSNWVVEAGREFSVFATPMNDNWEIAYSEITEGADGPYFGGVNLRFHHNLLENMQDDGIYLSQMYPRHIYMQGGAEIHIYQNVLRRALTMFAFGGFERETKDKVYIYRNIIDLRPPVQGGRPSAQRPDPAFSPGKMVGDHGGPPWPTMMIYHNTFLLRGYMVGLGTHTNPERPRHVFNNIVVHYTKFPGLQVPKPEHGTGDGNLYWCPVAEAKQVDTALSRYRASRDFEDSKKFYPPGFAANAVVGDPKFRKGVEDPAETNDYRLERGSPAIGAGAAVPEEWPDPLREDDKDQPDIGALPYKAKMFEVGRSGK